MFQPDHATHFAPATRAGLIGLFAPPTTLTPLERTVIALARDEADRGRWEATPARAGIRRLLACVVGAVTGRRARAGLADERLEALRRFVAMIRRRDRRAARVAQMLRAHGYRAEQLARIEALALA